MSITYTKQTEDLLREWQHKIRINTQLSHEYAAGYITAIDDVLDALQVQERPSTGDNEALNEVGLYR